MKQATYLLQGRIVAQKDLKGFFLHAQPTYPFGKFFFCPKCAEIWAGMKVESRDSFIEHRNCEKHQAIHWSNMAGSLWLSWDDVWNSNLPLELLKREFLLQYEVFNGTKHSN